MTGALSDEELDRIRSEWTSQCGPCDYGMPEYGCMCPSGDPRPVVAKLLWEIDRLRGESGAPA